MISAVIPCYNDQPRLDRLLKNLANQTRRLDEIVVVDDGSKKPIVVDAPVRVVRIKNAGPGVARNVGVANTTGEHVFLCDADVEVLPTTIEVLEKAIGEATVAYSEFIWDEGLFAFGPYSYEKLLASNSIPAIALVKREHLLEFRNGLYEDWDLWLRMLNPLKYPGRTAVHVPRVLFRTIGRRRSANTMLARGTPEGVVLS